MVFEITNAASVNMKQAVIIIWRYTWSNILISWHVPFGTTRHLKVLIWSGIQNGKTTTNIAKSRRWQYVSGWGRSTWSKTPNSCYHIASNISVTKPLLNIFLSEKIMLSKTLRNGFFGQINRSVPICHEKAPSVLNASLHLAAPLTHVTLPTALPRRLHLGPPIRHLKLVYVA